MKLIHVAVGVIVRKQKIFLTKRAADVHQGNKWEFPGGKVEPNETLEQALARELQEEIGIQITHHQGLIVIEHDYGDKQVKLDVHLITEFQNEPHGQEGQLSQWLHYTKLKTLEFPEANNAIIEAVEKWFA